MEQGKGVRNLFDFEKDPDPFSVPRSTVDGGMAARYDAHVKLLQRLKPLLPWLSLLSGIASALMMDRRPERAWMVVLGSLVGWLALLGFAAVQRYENALLAHQRGKVVQAARFLGRLLTQSGTQLALFFSLPFYVRAYGGLVGHAFFTALLGVAAALTLWDPLYERWLQQPVRGAALLALASFAGLNVVLPILGLPDDQGLMAAALGASIMLPIAVGLSSTPEQRLRQVGVACIVAVGLPLALLSQRVRQQIPAVPLRLVSVALGTQLRGPNLLDPTPFFAQVPARLICATTIAGPPGLKESLYHTWYKNGVLVDRIGLDVVAGDTGYRTWSSKANLGGAAPAAWRCVVVTATGQTLGYADTQIGSDLPSN